ncbi:putative transposase of the Rover1 hAT-like family [Lachancea dasiensis]|uniref:Putative transposase of the Rover1 hAT-like family n=1 Tax=Lachancea dasiensis TaxID=1072105 RepID=A0A1G4JAY8_9SACH|nr:putative transposase of the Rover1 hAT-like family [Lachancea dasiensis]
MNTVKTGVLDKANAFAEQELEHESEQASAERKANGSPGGMQATNEETIAAAITQLNSHQHQRDHDPVRTEQQFKDTYGFDFRDFSMNPCLKPTLDTSIKDDSLNPKTAARFDNWLRLSPFGIWVTKYATSKPYAQCKYSHCQLQFKFDGHANTSNIIKHMKRRHKDDYQLFISLLGRDQNRKTSSAAIGNTFENSANGSASGSIATRKAFTMRKELAPFLNSKQFPQRQLNVFIDSLLPLSTASSFAQFLKACNFNNAEFLLTPDDLVLKLDEYYHEFQTQLKETLAATSMVNVILDVWSGTGNKMFVAIMVSFCPNLTLVDQVLKRESITAKTGPNVHVLDLLEVEESLRSLLPLTIQTLSDYGIQSKVGSITLDAGSSNNPALADLPDKLRSSLQVDQPKSLIEIRSLSHTLESVAQLLIQVFQENYPLITSRIDGLTDVLESNILLRHKFKSYLHAATPLHANSFFGTISRYNRMCEFLKTEEDLKTFYSQNLGNDAYGLKAEHKKFFVCSTDEVAVLSIFLKTIAIFFDYIKLLENDSVNMLPNGIDYYLQVGQFFQASDRILSGIYEEQDIVICGLREEDMMSISEDARNNIFTIISTCGSFFNTQLEWVLQQGGFWVAHMLQPHCKTNRLSDNFDDRQFKEAVLQNASTYIEHYTKTNAATLSHGMMDNDIARGNPNRVTKPDSLKRRRAELDLTGEEALVNFTEHELGSRSEWASFLAEPAEESADFVKYWLKNQKKFPSLAKLALSLYNSKLSSNKVESWFHVGRDAIGEGISQATMSLKQAFILRNRLICFEPGHKLNFVDFVAAHQWATDENRALGSADGI